jgi:hypothetical protein
VIITSEEFCANQNLAVVQPAMYTSKVQWYYKVQPYNSFVEVYQRVCIVLYTHIYIMIFWLLLLLKSLLLAFCHDLFSEINISPQVNLLAFGFIIYKVFRHTAGLKPEVSCYENIR